jgi:hypothetical protein
MGMNEDSEEKVIGDPPVTGGWISTCSHNMSQGAPLKDSCTGNSDSSIFLSGYNI